MALWNQMAVLIALGLVKRGWWVVRWERRAVMWEREW
jgi:ribosomal protein L30/L7E